MEIGNEITIIGRSPEDLEKYGRDGTGFLGRVVLSKGDKPVLGRKVFIDLARPHLIIICGKRGYGKSYTMAVLLEEFARLPSIIKNRISVIVIDTVGIFWSLKIPARENLDELANWDLQAEATDVRVLVPKGFEHFYREKKIPIDGTFSIKTSELSGIEWMALFGLNWNDPEGVLITRIIDELKEKFGSFYGIDDIIKAIEMDSKADELVKQSLINRLKAAKTWGIFEKTGFKVRDIAKSGVITVIDVSAYRQALEMQGLKELIVAIIGKKLFEERMLYRKEEEARLINENIRASSMPLVWLFIDEAHMFMPKDRKSIALDIMLEWARVGRQPGLSLVLATQRPAKLHADFLSQCDIFISHRMTANQDIESVSVLRPNYLYQDLAKYYQEMPRTKGFALVLDDNSEKLWFIKVRPRLSWDAGVTATAFLE